MDVWGMLFCGRQWTEDDGSQQSTVYAAEQFKVTMIQIEHVDPTDAAKFKVHFAGMTAEVLNMVEKQLNHMRDGIIHRAKAGDVWRVGIGEE